MAWSWQLEPGSYYEYIDAYWDHSGGGREYLVCEYEGVDCEHALRRITLTCQEGEAMPCDNGTLVVEGDFTTKENRNRRTKWH